MNYNLRPTSLSNTKLDAELRRYGAHTSGSLERKQERLQRFVDAAQKWDDLRVVVQEEQRKVYLRSHQRAAELSRR